MASRIENTLSPFDLFSSKRFSTPASSETSADLIEMTKPVLSTTNPMRRYLQANQNVVAVAEGMMDRSIEEIQAERAELESLRTLQVERLKETLKTQDFSGFWGTLAKIGSMILAAISTIVGVAFCTTGVGTLIGGALIASGVLSIANLTLEESGGWDWIVEKLASENEEFRKKLRVLLPAGIGAISGLIGLGGAVFGWSSLNSISQFVTVMQTAANFVAAAVFGAKGIHSAQLAFAEAGQLEITREISEKEEDLDELINRFTMYAKQIQKELKSANKNISLQATHG